MIAGAVSTRRSHSATMPVSGMIRFVYLPLCLGLLAFGQHGNNRIGKIEFFGGSGIDIQPIRQALGVREGDRFPTSDEGMHRLLDRIKEAVRRETGRPPTDVAPVCCDERGAWMIYVGLPRNSATNITYDPPPAGAALLPARVVKVYDEAMEALLGAVRKGAGEDHSKGYALSTDPHLRGRQINIRECAAREEQSLYSVLESSRDAKHRAVAAHVLGYAPASERQIAALVRASRDSNETVRNNAVRALAVLADSGHPLAGEIPYAEFVPLLSSGAWTDRNKALGLLVALSRNRDPELLDTARHHALSDLIEMGRWRNPGHADPARILLGRIAGIPEDSLQELVRTQQVESIIATVRARN